MKSERVLALDISSKTGWSLQVSSADGMMLEQYGQIPKSSEPVGTYPSNYVMWAYQCFGEILELIETHAPDVLVIEETSKGSKNAMSQKILEWIHFLLARLIKETSIKCYFLLTEEWRRVVGCNRMTKEDKARNKEVREYKKVNKTSVSYDKKGKRIGLINRKHLNVRKANELYKSFLKEPLIMAQEDTADSLLLGMAYHMRRLEGKV